MSFYREGNYQEALRLLTLLDRVYPDHGRLTGSRLMQGKSLYKIGEYRRALDVFQKLVEDYPESGYMDDAVYGMGTAYYRMSAYRDAAKMFLEVVDRGRDRRLQRKAAKLSSEIMDSFLTNRDLEVLLSDVGGEQSQAAVAIRLAQREMDSKQFQSAQDILGAFLEAHPESSYASQITRLMRRAEESGKGSLKIGVILPLSGEFQEQGQGLLDGIRYAVNLHNIGEGAEVELVVKDSGGNIVRAVRAAQELCHQKDVLALIGDLRSEVTAAVAAVASENGVALLTPLALADGLASIGPSVFQMNGSLRSRGEELAQYAVGGLGLQKFAVMYPADTYGRAMYESFAEKVHELGGEVLAERWYFEGAEDLGPQFKAIREEGLSRMIEDSLIVIVPEEEYEELYFEEPHQDGILYVKDDIAMLVDSTDLAVTAFDGIFLPVYSEDLPYVMPQFAFYNIDARIFGGDYWHNMEALTDHQRYIDGVIFLTDYYIDPSNFKYFRFRDEFRRGVGKTPEKMEVFGYDTMTLLLSVAGEEALPRDEIRDRLARMGDHFGIRGVISLNEDRINRKIRLLQFRGGNILQIK